MSCEILSAKDYQYKLLRNEILEDDFICIISHLPNYTPRKAEELRDRVKATLIDTMPEIGAKHPMTMRFLRRVELSKIIFR